MTTEEATSPFVTYAEEWNNYPSESVELRRYRKGRERGTRWGRYPENREMTAEQVIDYAKQHHWSPDYAEGVYDALQATKPVEETA